MSEWKRMAIEWPPVGKEVLAWGPETGMNTVHRNHYPAWEPFDEEQYKGATLLEGLVDNLRRLNELSRGEPARDSWACVCEESYWDLEKFTHWMELPPAPEAG